MIVNDSNNNLNDNKWIVLKANKLQCNNSEYIKT